MTVTSSRDIAAVSIIIEIGTQIGDNIILAVANPQTITTCKRSMIDKVTFIHTAIILWNIAAVNAMHRGDLVAILIMRGDQVVTG